jgi:hypothetical protein
MVARFLSGFTAALLLAANGEPFNFELEVSKHEVRDYFGTLSRITPNGNYFDYFTFPGDRSVGFSYGLIDEEGENVSAWSLNEGGFGGTFLRLLPDDPQLLGASFLRNSSVGFGVFDKDSLKPVFIKQASTPDQFQQRLQPLESGRTGFQILTEKELQFVVIGTTGEHELDLIISNDGQFNWFRFQAVSESITDDGYFLNWQVIDRDPDTNNITTLKTSANGTPIWIKDFSIPIPADLNDRHFPTPDGGFLYAIPIAEDQTLLVKIESDGQLGFAQSLNLKLDNTSSFKFKNQSLCVGLEGEDEWHLLEINLTNGVLLNSIVIAGSEEILHSQIVAVSEEKILIYLEEKTEQSGVTQGHLVTIDSNWQISNTRDFECNGDPFGFQFTPNIVASTLSDGSIFFSLMDPVRQTLHGFTLLDSLPPSFAAFIREIESPLVSSESGVRSVPFPLELTTASSSTIVQGATQIQPAQITTLAKVNIDFTVPANERPRFQARIERQQEGCWRIYFKTRIGCRYQLWSSDQLSQEFYDTGDALEGTGDELYFEFSPDNLEEYFKIKEIVEAER